MSVVARQLGRPRGLLGRIVGRGLARNNADFNRWLVREIRGLGLHDVKRIVELGPGPGVGLQETLRAFPDALVWGVDPSPEMVSQSRKRNRAEVDDGRLVMVEGGVEALEGLAPVDLVLAVHVLYFWPQPAAEMGSIHSALRSGGWLGLGYQLRPNMPPDRAEELPESGAPAVRQRRPGVSSHGRCRLQEREVRRQRRERSARRPPRPRRSLTAAVRQRSCM
jgi:SAM-dependent methyltransferase